MRAEAANFIAGRYLLGRGKEGGRYLRGAVMGIALSLVPIITTLVVADGMIFGITERYLELSSYHYQIYSRSITGDVTAAQAVVADVAGVRGVWPEIQGMGLLVGSKASSGVTIRAIAPDFLTDEGVVRYLHLKAGELSLDDARSALIGEALAKKTGVQPGDTIRLMVVRSGIDGRKIPKVSLFTVRGVIASGYQELDALWCFIPYEVGRSFLPPESARPFLGIKVDNPHSSDQSVRVRISAELSSAYSLFSWYDLQRSQYQSYETTRQLLLFIMFLAVFVAAVNVSSATSMLVVERRRDIAILKSFGASPGDTTAIFLLAAGLTGSIGTILGTGIGLLTAINVNGLIRIIEYAINGVSLLSARLGGHTIDSTTKILDPAYYLETIPIIISWKTVILIAFGAILCSILAAWAPARRAGRLAPLDILRKY